MKGTQRMSEKKTYKFALFLSIKAWGLRKKTVIGNIWKRLVTKWNLGPSVVCHISHTNVSNNRLDVYNTAKASLKHCIHFSNLKYKNKFCKFLIKSNRKHYFEEPKKELKNSFQKTQHLTPGDTANSMFNYENISTKFSPAASKLAGWNS